MPFLGLQTSFTAGELSPSLAVRVDLSRYQTGCKCLENMLVHPHGGASKRNGFRYLATLPSNARLMPFIFSKLDTYALVWTQNRLEFFNRDGAILSSDGVTPYSIESPYTSEEARELSFVQSADVIYLASKNHYPYKLLRYAHNEWVLEQISFTPKSSPPTGLRASLHDVRTEGEISGDGNGTRMWYYVVTKIDENGEESLASARAGVSAPENLRSTCYPKLAWSGTVGNGIEYRIYQEKNGKYGYIGSSLSTYFDAKNIASDMTDCPPEDSNPFVDNNFPNTVCFFQQRLVFGGSNLKPQTLWFSRTGNYESFSSSSPAKPDDSMEISIAGNEVSHIEWLVALRTLLVGTSGTEWEVKSSGGALSASDVSIVPQSYRGSANLPALIVGNSVLHVSRTNREMRDLLYDFGTDSYTGSDHAVLANHLFEEESIVDWAYQQSPNSIIWCVRSDGVLLGHTHLREHEVFAWHRHITQGKFQSICTLPSTNEDELFAVIERVINGETVYFLERMENSFNAHSGGAHSKKNKQSMVFFSDCALSYEGEPISRVIGLDHLLGEEVCIIADGSVSPNQIVRKLDGDASKIGIELPFSASIIIVGLPYTARLKSMPLEPELGSNTIGRKKYINRIGVYFKDTNSAHIGTDFDNPDSMDEVKWRLSEKPGEAVNLHTEDAWIYTNATYDSQVHACVESRVPLPCSVLAIMPEVNMN